MGVKKRLVWIDPDTGIRYDKETGRVLPEKKGSSYEVIMERRGGQKRIKPLRYQARHRKNTFLKYWRIVRYWAKRKYDISQEELEVLLYLYDEELFSMKQFKQFEGLLTWDKTRFKHFRDKGWIVVWREHKGYKQRSKLYTLSVGAKRMCNEVYKKLTQEEPIPTTHQNNPIFKGDNYQDKMYRKLIMIMNAKKAEEESNPPE